MQKAYRADDEPDCVIVFINDLTSNPTSTLSRIDVKL